MVPFVAVHAGKLMLSCLLCVWYVYVPTITGAGRYADLAIGSTKSVCKMACEEASLAAHMMHSPSY